MLLFPAPRFLELRKKPQGWVKPVHINTSKSRPCGRLLWYNYLMQIPEKTKEMFWDVEPGELDPEKHRNFIITRIAEKGRLDDIKWLRSIYSDIEIRDVVAASRNTSPRVKSYWEVISHA